MRRFSIVFPILAVFLIGLVATRPLGSGAVARADATATSEHPVVGAWLLDLGEEGGRLLTFSADGTVLFAEADGTTGQGTWEVTGDSTAVFTTYRLISDQSAEDSSFIGYSILSGEIAIDADGQWTGDLVVAQTERDGVIAFSDGPFTLPASR
ncbi:MAG TPA: hypothetical protein VGR16_02480, partial [Thermomicrobiales bacterium]|nr:hypothetical protein [Thermomicrobiales bacterium]